MLEDDFGTDVADAAGGFVFVGVELENDEVGREVLDAPELDEVVVAASSRYTVFAGHPYRQAKLYAEGSILGEVANMVILTHVASPLHDPMSASTQLTMDQAVYHFKLESSS